jgi:hypothetical protein
MSMPGFTAEASLGKASGHYNMEMTSVSASGQVIPQGCIDTCLAAYWKDYYWCNQYGLDPGSRDACIRRANLTLKNCEIVCWSGRVDP